MGIGQGAELILSGDQRSWGLLGAAGKLVRLDMVVLKSGTAGEKCQKDQY